MDLMTHAYSLGTGTGNFPTATEWLTIGGSANVSLTVTTFGGNSVSLGALPPGMYPIRCIAVTANSGGTVTGWWR